MTLREALLDHLTAERRPIDRHALCDELELISAYSGRIPCAACWEWDEEVGRMAEDGLVILAGPGVMVNRDALGGQATETKTEPQPTLF